MSKKDTIKNLLKDILIKMNASFEEIKEEDDGIGIVRLNVISEQDSRVLIGPHGEHLQAINTILKRITETKEEQEEVSYIIDVNNYQKKHLEELRDQTKIIAERVKLFKKEMPLPAMSAYERMIVHAVAGTIEGIKTRSEGAGNDRYVVVIPS